jgi:predicted dehydrogenase
MHRLRNKKDDSLLRAFADELEAEGIRIEPSTLFLPSLLAPSGVLTRRKPNHREQLDIEFGWQLAKEFGALDIGQCLLVKDQAVLAVEGIDGTDATILRGGRLCGQGAVVIKVSKPIQDLRFDVPAVGLNTILTMKRVKARVLVVEAGRTLMFDRDRMIDTANDSGISIVVRSQALERLPGRDIEQDSRIEPTLLPGSGTSQPCVLVRQPRADALRVGVVGVGYLGRYHAEKYAALPQADLVAVIDIDGERANSVAQTVCTEGFADYRELLGRVDAVSIVTPTREHFRLAREFLTAGVHVLLEKPMTQTLEEADELIALAQQNQCVLQIGHLERFNPAFRAIAPRLRRPMFMEAHRLALFTERGLEVDVILDLMIHDLDIVLQIMQEMPSEIRASGIPVLTPLPDIATVRLEFANGAVANLTASRISTKTLRKLRVFQEDSYIVADYAHKRAYTLMKEPEMDSSGFPELSMEELEIEETDALGEEIIAFLDAIRARRPAVVDGVQGRRALALALEVSRRIREHILATSHKLGPFPRELEAPDGDGEVESQIAGEG